MIRKITCIISALVFGLTFQNAFAQSDEKKFEVGGQVSVLQTATHSLNPGPGFSLSETKESEFGFGGRFGYNISNHFAIEAEGNFFPRDRDLQGGRKIQGLFGVKAGKKFDKVGVFAKARPGFIRFERGDYEFGPNGCIAVFPPPLACYRPVAKTNMAFDVGGVLELYPSARTIIRFDAGDTIIRFGDRLVAATNPAIPPPSGLNLVVFPVSAETKHNFQASVGVGFRF